MIRIDCAASIVLGLGEQIGGDPGRVVLSVGDHHHLGRPCHHVDADLAVDLALGGGDIGVAGADDLGYGRDALGAISERSDRLRAAEAIDLIDAGKRCRHQNERIERAFKRRHDHDDALDAGDLGWHGVHQHRARIARGAARHIEPSRGDRSPALPELDAGRVDVAIVFGKLPVVVVEDALMRELERCERPGVDPGSRRFDLRDCRP